MMDSDGQPVKDAETEGGSPSNTHPPTSNGVPLESYPGAVVTGGYDWLTSSFGVRWSQSRLATLVSWLDDAKQEAREAKREAVLTQVPEFGNIVVYPSSFVWGGSKGTRLEFKVRIDGTEVGLSRKSEATSSQPNVVVIQTGADCLIRGGRERYEYMCDTIAALGGRIEWAKVSRADLALDIAGLGVDVLQDLFETDHFVTRAKTAHPFANKVTRQRTGFSVGRAPCYLTVYDKLLEVSRKRRTEYINAMCARRWGGSLPSHATRVEWQLRRETLRKLHVDAPEDLFSRASEIFQHLMSKQFRLTTRMVDRKNNNQSKCETHALWREIASHANSIFGISDGDPTPPNRKKIPPLTTIKIARGHMKSALLDLGIELVEYDDLVAEASRLFLELGDSYDEQLADQDAFMRDYQTEFIKRGLDDAGANPNSDREAA